MTTQLTDTTTPVPTIDDRIRETLNAVHDPCSLAANAPIGLVDMGLVVGWKVDDAQNLEVTLTVTAPGCMLAPKFALDAELRLRALGIFGDIDITFQSGIFWTEDRMAPAARARLNARRASSNRQLNVTPQAWKQAAAANAHPQPSQAT